MAMQIKLIVVVPFRLIKFFTFFRKLERLRCTLLVRHETYRSPRLKLTSNFAIELSLREIYSVVFVHALICAPKGPGKRGHIVADTLLPTQMFPRFPALATFVVRDTKNVSDFVQKHFVSTTNVSQFTQPKKHHEQQCVRNNVSSFASSLMTRISLLEMLIVENSFKFLKSIEYSSIVRNCNPITLFTKKSLYRRARKCSYILMLICIISQF